MFTPVRCLPTMRPLAGHVPESKHVARSQKSHRIEGGTMFIKLLKGWLMPLAIPDQSR